MTQATTLRQDAAQIGKDVEQLIRSVGAESSAGVQSLREQLGRTVEVAVGKARALESDVRDRAVQTAKATDEYAHTHPWQLIGAAAAAGLLIGALVARR